MTRILIFLTLFAAAVAAANLMTNSTYNVQFVVIRNPFDNKNYTYLYPPKDYLCVYRGAFYINVNNTLYHFSGQTITAYAWPGSALFCDSLFTSCVLQRGVVFSLRAYAAVESAQRELYVYNTTTKRWEPIVGKRLVPGIVASISPTSPPPGSVRQYAANLTYIDTADNVLKTGEFTVRYYVTQTLTQPRDYAVCIRVNTTLFPFYSSLLRKTVVALYTAQRADPSYGDISYVLYVEPQGGWVVSYDGFLFSSVGYFSLVNHTTFIAQYTIFSKNSSTIFGSLTNSAVQPHYYLPVDEKTNAGTEIYVRGTSSIEASFFTEKHYAYYLSKPRSGFPSNHVYLVGESDTLVVAAFKGDNNKTSYAAFPLCPPDKIMFYTVTFPTSHTIDRVFDIYGAALVQNNSTKTLYILLVEAFSARTYKTTAEVRWVWRVPPGGSAVVPAVWYTPVPGSSGGYVYYRLLYALDSPCTGQYKSFAPRPGQIYAFDGAVFLIAGGGNQAEWIELFKQLLQLLSALHNQTSTVVKNPKGYTYSGQGIVNAATSLSTSAQLQHVYAFSIASQQGSYSAFSGVNIPSIASIALALLLAFTVAVGVAKTREDPADRLAAVYAVFVPTVVMFSLFFTSDLAAAAAIAAALIALAYAIHAARL
jgi:hypothetical protein